MDRKKIVVFTGDDSAAGKKNALSREKTGLAEKNAGRVRKKTGVAGKKDGQSTAGTMVFSVGTEVRE